MEAFILIKAYNYLQRLKKTNIKEKNDDVKQSTECEKHGEV